MKLSEWGGDIDPMTTLADSFTQMVDLISNLEEGQGVVYIESFKQVWTGSYMLFGFYLNELRMV